MAVVVMTFVIAMAFVIIMIIAMVIVVAMIFIMIVVIIMLVVIIDVNLAVEVLSLSPNQSGANGSFDCKRAAIAQAPLENATKKTIEGVMPWLIFEIVVETAMALDGENGREVEITSFKGFTRSTMGAMGFGR